ncbi:hypothetical protein TNCV_2719241 [Trichonephila clavipes]|nr:hypothetical protein TNCV_2719241 [Trichonephila clavipes]
MAEGNALAADAKGTHREMDPTTEYLLDLNGNLCEYGSLRGDRVGGGNRTSSIEQNVVDTVRRNTSTSVRNITAAVGSSLE